MGLVWSELESATNSVNPKQYIIQRQEVEKLFLSTLMATGTSQARFYDKRFNFFRIYLTGAGNFQPKQP